MHDKLIYHNSTLCHICNEEHGKDRMRDHCHLFGRFRGAAHAVCNLKTRFQSSSELYFTIFYGSHRFIKTLGNSVWNISYIPTSEENYIAFTKQVIVDTFFNKEWKEIKVKRELRFIDNLRFMASSLDKLSSNLKIDQFVNSKKYYKKYFVQKGCTSIWLFWLHE